MLKDRPTMWELIEKSTRHIEFPLSPSALAGVLIGI